jgi:hypothetical protein
VDTATSVDLSVDDARKAAGDIDVDKMGFIGLIFQRAQLCK